MNFIIHKKVTNSNIRTPKSPREGNKTPDTIVKIPAKVKRQLEQNSLSEVEDDSSFKTEINSVRYHLNSLDKDLRAFIHNGKLRQVNIKDSGMNIILHDGTRALVQIFDKYHHYHITKGKEVIFSGTVVPTNDWDKNK